MMTLTDIEKPDINKKLALHVFNTMSDSATLASFVEGLRSDAGYGAGLNVYKDEKVRGKYLLERHNGEQNIDSGTVEIMENQIWVGKYTGLIEGVLRGNRIPYQLGVLHISVGEIGTRKKPYDVSDVIEVTYTPKDK
ncbi:MAG: hypothetical protein Q7S74_06760 [Nanoarchaeota archaeon]|nr:hypothetical protein [Nanoarchaeota archaeon]